MKKLAGIFLAVSTLLAIVSAHGQISLIWPGPGITVTPGGNNCTVSGTNSVTTVGGTLAYVFTSSGTLTCPSARTVNLLVVGGGGSGGNSYAGGGGAGEVVTYSSYSMPSGATTVTVGAGGAAVATGLSGNNGGDSTIGSCTAKGGGGGGQNATAGASGGSGGGGGNSAAGGTSIAGGNCSGGTGRGFAGGTNSGSTGGAGGGGAGSAGSTPYTGTTNGGGTGGKGFISSITGFSVQYGCGGAGAGRADSTGNSGAGGCSGAGIGAGGNNATQAGIGRPNTGDGGGGAPGGTVSGVGGSGIVVVQEATAGGVVSSLCTVTGTAWIGRAGTNTTYTFTGNGSISCPSAVQVNYLLVGGGGGGGGANVSNASGGGGAGGVRTGAVQLNASQTYDVIIGSGGAGATSVVAGGIGQASIFDVIATVRGGGGGGSSSTIPGTLGASGGGGANNSAGGANVPGQGYQALTAASGVNAGSGGGGSTGVGSAGNATSTTAGVVGKGGPGFNVDTTIFGAIPDCVSGGATGGRYQSLLVGSPPCGAAGFSGGSTASQFGTAGGDAIVGGGGGGGGNDSVNGAGRGGNGGPGLLVVSHPTAQPATICTANTDGGGSDANVMGLWHVDQMTADSIRSGTGVITGTATTISSAQSKFGGYALSSGTAASNGLLVGSPPSVGTGDFTVEFWGNVGAFSGATPMFFGDTTSTQFYTSATTQFSFVPGSLTFNGSTLPSGSWHHYAVVRRSGNISAFLDGSQYGSSAASASTLFAGTNFCWGTGTPCPNGSWYLNGYEDEMRISNVARYQTTGFTPPTTPFCDPVASPIGMPTLFAQSGQLAVSGSSLTTTTTDAITSGNLAIIAIGQNNNSVVTITGVSDGTNTYAQAAHQTNASAAFNDIWYKANAAAVASGATITVTYSGANGGGFQHIIAAQASGIATASPFDKTAGANSATTTAPVTIPALTTAPQLDFCYARTSVQGAGSTISIPDPGWTNLYNALQTGSQNQLISLDWRAVTNPVSVGYNPTVSAAPSININACATFIHG